MDGENRWIVRYTTRYRGFARQPHFCIASSALASRLQDKRRSRWLRTLPIDSPALEVSTSHSLTDESVSPDMQVSGEMNMCFSDCPED